MSKLQPPALERYTALKKVISDGRTTFFEVGLAIAEIKERELYKEEYETWTEFCAKEYGWTRQHCTSLASAALALNDLPAGAVAVTAVSGAAAKALAKVPPPKRVEVLKKATVVGKPVTATAIKKATPPVPKKKDAAVAKDDMGLPIPPEALPTWERRQDAQELLAYLSALRGAVRKAQETDDKLFCRINYSSTLSHLDMAFTELKSAKPYAVCPNCQGRNIKDCGECRGLGMISEFHWGCVTEEVKALRKVEIDEAAK